MTYVDVVTEFKDQSLIRIGLDHIQGSITINKLIIAYRVQIIWLTLSNEIRLEMS